MKFRKLLPGVIAILLMGCDGSPTEGENAVSKPNGSDSPEQQTGPGDTSSGDRTGSLAPSTRGPLLPREEPSPEAVVDRAMGGMEPAPTDSEAGTSDNIDQLGDQVRYAQEPSARVEALRALAEEDKEAVRPIFETALQDNDQGVRKETLMLIYQKRIPVPSEVLHEVAVNDVADKIRGLAWINIKDRGGPELKGYLLDALNDPNPEIRRDAQIHLDRLDKLDQ
jgi:hypothetical protein